MAHNIIGKGRVIQWLNKHDYDFQIWVGHQIFLSHITISFSTPNLTRIKWRTKNRLRGLWHRVKNLALALVGYKLLDADYDQGRWPKMVNLCTIRYMGK